MRVKGFQTNRKGWLLGAMLLLLAPVVVFMTAQTRLYGDAQAFGSEKGSQQLHVDCDKGQTLAKALSVSQPGATIKLSGTCQETVTVTKDRLTLDGQGSAVLDGDDGSGNPAMTVDGARGLSIKGLTVQNGRHGILARNLATLSVQDTVIQGSQAHGMELINVSAEVSNLTSRDNGRVGVLPSRNTHLTIADSTMQGNLSGMVVFNNATVRLEGTNDVSQSATQGMTVGLGGAIFSIGSTLLANDNGAEGVFLLQGGKIQLIGGRLEASGNGSDGIKAEQGSSVTLGITEFGVPGEAETVANQGHGVNAISGSEIAVSEIMPLSSTDNAGAGLRLDGDSRGMVSGSVVQDSGGADVDLSFGSLATLNDNTIGTIVCDPTALSRGDTVCP